METKTKIIVFTVSLVAAFAAGRYAAPTKVVTETKIVEVETTKRKKDIIIHEITRPDGTKEKNTEIKERETKNDRISSDETRTITRASDKVTILGLAGVDFTSPGSKYGASISKPIIGPVTIGAFYLTPGMVGLGLGLTF